MSKDNSGPAFPIHPGAALDGQRVDETQGMTLRDYFAAKAMQGILCNSAKDFYPLDLVAESYVIADAMLKEREK